MDEERINQIEFRVAHQDQLIDELNQVIVQQRQEMDALRAQLRAVVARLQGLTETAGDGGAADEPPPHY